MTDFNELTDLELEALFSAGREELDDQGRDLPPGLRARILADAHFVTNEREQSLWRVFLKAVGGWPTISGVAVAGLAGLWIGMMPPAALESWEERIWGEPEVISLFMSADFFGEGI